MFPSMLMSDPFFDLVPSSVPRSSAAAAGGVRNRNPGDLVMLPDTGYGPLSLRFAEDMGVHSLDALLSQPLSLHVEDLGATYEISARPPAGIRTKDIHVEVSNNCLTISGERERRRQRSGVTSFQSFSRSVLLPENAVSERIAARVDSHGAVIISVPKRDGSGPRAIPILTEGAARKAPQVEESKDPAAAVGGDSAAAKGASASGLPSKEELPMNIEKENVARAGEPRTQSV